MFTREECKHTQFFNNNNTYINFGIDGNQDCLISIPVTEEMPECITDKLNDLLYEKMNEMKNKYSGDFPCPKELDLDARIQVNYNHLEGTEYYISGIITEVIPASHDMDIFIVAECKVKHNTEIEDEFIKYCQQKLKRQYSEERMETMQITNKDIQSEEIRQQIRELLTEELKSVLSAKQIQKVMFAYNKVSVRYEFGERRE